MVLWLTEWGWGASQGEGTGTSLLFFCPRQFHKRFSHIFNTLCISFPGRNASECECGGCMFWLECRSRCSQCNSRCRSLGSQSGRFYANTFRARMTQALVLLPSPPSSRLFQAHFQCSWAHTRYWGMQTLALCQGTFWQIGSVSHDYALIVLMSAVTPVPGYRDRQSVLS